jgi:uncharacterized membrane protein
VVVCCGYVDETVVWFGLVWFGLVWFGLVGFGLFVHPFSHACNIGHINYRSQFIYYNATYNIWTSTQYNIVNNNKGKTIPLLAWTGP